MRVCAGRTLQAFSVKLQSESGNMIGTIVNVICHCGGQCYRRHAEKGYERAREQHAVYRYGRGGNGSRHQLRRSEYVEQLVPVLFIASLAIGGAIGSSLRLGERMGNATSRRGGKELVKVSLRDACCFA